MFLALDIGNTNITAGLFDGDNLIKTERIISDTNLPIEKYENILKNKFAKYNIQHCMIGSVVRNLDKTLKSAVDKLFNIDSKLYSYPMKLEVNLTFENPQDAGADRVANACGAVKLYKTPIIIVDAGTSTTFDIIDKNRNFSGGLIMPGLNMQLNSLSENTSLLPNIKLKSAPKAIGIDTESAILSGVVRGHACGVEGLLKQCEAEMGEKAVIVGTGGLIKILSEHMDRKIDFINQNLTLEGFKSIYDYAFTN